MNERIQMIITACSIKKVEFARRLNISQSYVSELCSGKTRPSERTILDICREFNVNETWLRTGEGEIFVPLDKDEEFDALCYEIQMSDDEFIKDIMRKYWKLDENGKSIIRKMLSGPSEQ